MKIEFKKALINSTAGLLFCLVAGYLLYGSQIFYSSTSRFQILMFGVAGSIFFSVLKYLNSRNVIYSALMLYILDLVIVMGKNITLSYALRDFVLFFLFFSAILSYKIYITRYSNIPMFIRGFGLVFFLVVASILSTLTFAIIFDVSFSKLTDAILLNAFYSGVVGVSLSIGFDLFEKYEGRILNLIENVL